MIREMTRADIWPCYEIVAVNWNDAVAERFRQEALHKWLFGNKYPPQYWVWEEDGQVVAFAGMIESCIMTGVWDFIWINVKPSHAGRGIGRLLTEHRIEGVRKLGGSVIQLMSREYGFFKKLGFSTNFVYDGWVHMSMHLRELKI